VRCLAGTKNAASARPLNFYRIVFGAIIPNAMVACDKGDTLFFNHIYRFAGIPPSNDRMSRLKR